MNLNTRTRRVMHVCVKSIFGGLISSSLCVAHAQIETGVVFRLQELRVSGFLDGNLLADDRAPVVHPNAAGLTYAIAQAETSFPVPGLDQSWRLGAFVGAQAWIKTDAVRALAFVNNKEQADENASYPLSVSYQSARRVGLSIAKTVTIDLPQFSSAVLLTRARWFAIDRFKAGQADGSLIETASGQLGVQAEVTQYQLGGTSLFINPAKVLGWGATLDLGIRLQDHDGNYATLSVTDLGPAVRLPSVLYTNRKANTNNVSYDANGYVQYAPLIKGQYSPASYKVRFTPTLITEGGWKLNPRLHLITKLESTAPVHQIAIGGALNFYQQTLESLAYLGKGVPSSLSLAWRFKYGEIGWRGDRLSPSRARVWGLTAGVRF
jgi:hypothetical protein